MNPSDIPIFAALNERMKWINARQEVLSRNIAHADVPNFEALDIKALNFKKFLQEVKGAEPVRTDPHHLVGTKAASDNQTLKPKNGYEIAPSGNSVVLEEQMTKMAENQARYNLMVNLYRKQADLLKLAIGRTS